MTVHSLETAKDLVAEMGGSATAVYRYTHPLSRETLWSVETARTAGSTLRSGWVLGPVLVYDGKRWLP